MAESSTPTDEREPGAPIAKDAIDPELVRLKPTTSLGVITTAGVVFLCIVFLLRLHPDRQFGGNETAQPVTVQDIVAGRIDDNRYITVEAELVRAHAIRAARSKTGVGFRVVPAHGTQDRLWIVLSGDGWEPATLAGYTGRLRALDELTFADAVLEQARTQPRPMFATVAEARAGFASGEVTTITGERIQIAATDRVSMEVTDPGVAVIIAAFNERLPSAQAWTTALAAAGITAGAPIAPPLGQTDQIRFQVSSPDAVATVTQKLEAADLWAARVEPNTTYYQTEWSQLRTGATPGMLQLGTQSLPEASVDLIGLYVRRPIPDGAMALIVGEQPQDYWHVLPITVALGVFLLLFGWALVRAIKRDFLPPRPVA